MRCFGPVQHQRYGPEAPMSSVWQQVSTALTVPSLAAAACQLCN